jgi:hypothetical protein
LLKPILSRFCEIYIPEPMYENKIINLHQYNLSKTFKLQDVKTHKLEWLKKELEKTMSPHIGSSELLKFVAKLYEKGYSALYMIELVENNKITPALSDHKKYELLVAFSRVRKEFRNEKLLLLFILNFIYLDRTYPLENISFM